MKLIDFEKLIKSMENEDGNFQITFDGLKKDENEDITSISILCVASENEELRENELIEINNLAKKYFPKEYKFKDCYPIGNAGEDDLFFEFNLIRI